MDLFYLFLLAAAVLAIWRVVYQVRRAARVQPDDWDAKLIERLRRGGTADPFRPVELDFFVAMPTREGADSICAALTREGYVVDVREISESPDQPFSVHAVKSMHLTLDNVRESSARMRSYAAEFGGRFDGWAPGGPAG